MKAAIYSTSSFGVWNFFGISSLGLDVSLELGPWCLVFPNFAAL